MISVYASLLRFVCAELGNEEHLVHLSQKICPRDAQRVRLQWSDADVWQIKLSGEWVNVFLIHMDVHSADHKVGFPHELEVVHVANDVLNGRAGYDVELLVILLTGVPQTQHHDIVAMISHASA